ncbi:MAG: nucleotidyltransferase domain-containing protein [Prevotellaceae bacterium]|jgi:type I restriction enzyme S subunit|nr:nucleotidyltransferase domain-containing protein [Prevotellaceae bacterium]
MMYGLQDTEIQKIQSVLAKYPEVDEAVLYGSRAKGNYKPYSDIDLTLKGSPTLDSSLRCRIDFELDDLLLPYFMDLSVFSMLRNPELIEHINRAGKILYAKQN